MSDEIDQAAELEQFNTEMAIKNRHRPELKFTCRCRWCDEAIKTGSFCDLDCRDDYEGFMRAEQQRRQA